MAQARKAYELGNSVLRGPRSTEYEAFARVTRALSRATQGGTGIDHASIGRETVSALHENRRLWTLLAASVADPENALPNDLRARLFYLYEFTTVHTRKVLRREAATGPLVDVNTAVMAGLRSGGA